MPRLPHCSKLPHKKVRFNNSATSIWQIVLRDLLHKRSHFASQRFHRSQMTICLTNTHTHTHSPILTECTNAIYLVDDADGSHRKWLIFSNHTATSAREAFAMKFHSKETISCVQFCLSAHSSDHSHPPGTGSIRIREPYVVTTAKQTQQKNARTNIKHRYANVLKSWEKEARTINTSQSPAREGNSPHYHTGTYTIVQGVARDTTRTRGERKQKKTPPPLVSDADL